MLNLKHFVLKSEGRKLYRDVLRALKGVDEQTAAGVRQAARDQFKDHADETDVERELLPAVAHCFLAYHPLPTACVQASVQYL